jgi:hypothetical protein
MLDALGPNEANCTRRIAVLFLVELWQTRGWRGTDLCRHLGEAGGSVLRTPNSIVPIADGDRLFNGRPVQLTPGHAVISKDRVPTFSLAMLHESVEGFIQ